MAGIAAMSTTPTVRRPDKLMPEWRVRKLLEDGYCGRIGTVGTDGRPYVCPLLYVFADGEIWLHTTRARGHLRTNVDHEKRVCFEVDEAGAVFPYGRFECDTSIEYRSVVVFGRIRSYPKGHFQDPAHPQSPGRARRVGFRFSDRTAWARLSRSRGSRWSRDARVSWVPRLGGSPARVSRSGGGTKLDLTIRDFPLAVYVSETAGIAGSVWLCVGGCGISGCESRAWLAPALLLVVLQTAQSLGPLPLSLAAGNGPALVVCLVGR
jgi:hypothetical protein